MLTAVSTQRATILDYLYIKFNKPVGIELDHISEHLPEGMNMVEYWNLWMSSCRTARIRL